MKIIIKCFTFFFIAVVSTSYNYTTNCNDMIMLEATIFGNQIDFSDGLKMEIEGKNKIYKPLISNNGFCKPKFQIKDSFVSVRFIFKNRKYLFSKLHVDKFNKKWVFGVEKRFPDKKCFIKRKKLYYYIIFWDETIVSYQKL